MLGDNFGALRALGERPPKQVRESAHRPDNDLALWCKLLKFIVANQTEQRIILHNHHVLLLYVHEYSLEHYKSSKHLERNY